MTIKGPMIILALDLGTKTGYCYGDRATALDVGTLTLATTKEITGFRKARADRRCDPRIGRLWTELRARFDPDLVVFEDVEFSSYTKQTQLWSSLRSVVWLVFPKAQYECVPVGTLKKFATGAGNATKEMMMKAFYRPRIPVMFSRRGPLDDNGIDAAWIWLWASHNLSRLTIAPK